jgi:hypothetical protein
MKAIFDSTFVILLINPAAKPPHGPTGAHPGEAAERIEFLIDTLDNQRADVLIPVPVLAKLLIQGKPPLAEILTLLQSTRGFRFLPFDFKAAVECGALLRSIGQAGNRKGRAGPRSSLITRSSPSPAPRPSSIRTPPTSRSSGGP